MMSTSAPASAAYVLGVVSGMLVGIVVHMLALRVKPRFIRTRQTVFTGLSAGMAILTVGYMVIRVPSPSTWMDLYWLILGVFAWYALLHADRVIRYYMLKGVK